MTPHDKAFLAEMKRLLKEDMIKPDYRDYIECVVLSIVGVIIAGIIVAIATWFTVG